MKTSKKITTIFIFSLIASISIAQTGIKVTYVKGLKSIKAPANKPPSILKDVSFLLVANNEESSFYLDEKMSTDDLENRRYASKNIFYRNLKTKTLLELNHFIEGPYLISRKFDKQKWTLHNESKKIGKYKCYKATYNEEEINAITQEIWRSTIVAWYTLDIPLPFGPLDYGGLPGLILYIKEGGVYYIADKVEVNVPIAPEEIKKPTKGRKMTEEEYFNHLKNMFPQLRKKK